MIYISAQPDEVYFLWQLELQLYNFHSVGIGNESIHILVGYSPEKGIHPFFKEFADKHKETHIYFYPDNRKKKKYLPSIRPHLLSQHFKNHQELEKETIFYHDSDILFTDTPNWDSLCKDEVWYVSDTHSYLDSKYFRRFVDDNEFAKICDILSLTPEDVIKQDDNAGGAQYILKKCTSEFWNKVENDCERLFTYLHNGQKHGTRIQKGLQIWCTDMWVIWWNAILQRRSFRIHPALDFCWADSPSDDLKKKKILHYTGNKRSDICIFEKTLYQTHSPFYSDLSPIMQNTCSQFVVKTIQAYREELDKKRPKEADIRLALMIPDARKALGKASIVKNYYERYWNIEIIICETEGTSTQLKHDKINVLTPYNQIIPIEEMKRLLDCIKNKKDVSYKFKLKVRKMDSLGSYIFSNVLDDRYLEENKGKTMPVSSMEDLSVIYRSEKKKRKVEQQIINVGIFS